MHADTCIYPLGQTFLKLARLPDNELDGLLRSADLVREELRVDCARHPTLGELRQAFAVGRGLGHTGRPGLYSLPSGVAGGLGRPRLLLGQPLYEPAQPAGERAALRRIPPPEAKVGVGVDRAGDDRVVGEEPDLDVRVFAAHVPDRPDGLYVPAPDEDG